MHVIWHAVCVFVLMVFMCHRWWFGDGGNRTHQIKPPYDNPTSNQVVICDDVEYVYLQPGKLNRIWCIHIDLSRFLVVLLIFFISTLIFLLISCRGVHPIVLGFQPL